MAVTRSFNVLGSERWDAPFQRLVESAVRNDFDLLAGIMISGRRPLVLTGFTIATFAIGVAPELLTLVVDGGVSMHFGATASGTIFSVPPGRASETLSRDNPRVVGSFSAGTTNYVGLDIRRSPDPATKDFVTFLDDPVAGTEAQRQVPLAETLDYVIVISALPFSVTPALLPIATVRTDGFGLTAEVLDARNMLGRLAIGGDLPDPLSGWAWPQGRRELAGRPFSGGDKAIASLKDSLDAIMTRLWEIAGGERWSSAVSDRNVKFFRGGTTFTNGEYFEWDGSNLHWRGLSFVLPNSTGLTNAVADQLTSTPGLTDLADKDCLYVDLDYSADHVGGGALALLKAPLQNLGAPAAARSRTVIAWRSGAYIYVRDSYYPVGQDLFPQLRNAASSILLYQRARLACTTSPVVSVAPLGTFYVTSAGDWVALTHSSASTLNISTLLGVPGIVADTRYYLYAKDAGGGTVAFEASTTPPDESLRWKDGPDTSRAFVGTCSTSAAPALFQFRAVGGSYRYIGAPNTDLSLQVVGTPLQATATTTVLYTDAQVPAFAYEAGMEWTASSTLANSVAIDTVGTGGYTEKDVAASTTVTWKVTVPFGVGGAPNGFDYRWTVGTGGGATGGFPFVLEFSF